MNVPINSDSLASQEKTETQQRLESELAYWADEVACKPNSVEAYMRMGEILNDLGHVGQATQCLQRALDIVKKIKHNELALAHSLLSERRFNEAYEVWLQVLAHNPDLLEFRHLPDTWFQEGRIDLSQRLWQVMTDTHLEVARSNHLDSLQVRFLRGFANQIGHIAHLDWYVKRDKLGLRSPHRPIILAEHTPNPCYLNYWRRYIPDIIVSPAAFEQLKPLSMYLEDWLFTVLDSNGQQIVDPFYNKEYAIQKQWDEEKRPALLTLTAEDNERGRSCLKEKFGMPSDAWFVSLHVKEDKVSYYHQGTREGRIETYIPAIKEIVDRGGWVFRMGDPAMSRLPEIPGVIDYAHSDIKSDWMDVFLWAQCRFFVGTNSGPAFVPPTFGVPVVITNWSPVGLPVLFSNSLYIFKNLWLESEQRYLSISELLSNTLGFTNSPVEINLKGVRLVDNTPEEIVEVVKEMFDRLDGKKSYTDYDNDLQNKFNRIEGKSPSIARVGQSFLYKYASLL